MYKAKIIDIKKIPSITGPEDILSVEFDIIDEHDAVLASRKLGFTLETSQDVIIDELRRYVVAFENDEQIGKASAETEAANASADETIAALKDAII